MQLLEVDQFKQQCAKDLRDETGDAARGPRYARSIRRSILRGDMYPRRKKILADGRMEKAGALQLRSLMLKFPS